MDNKTLQETVERHQKILSKFLNRSETLVTQVSVARKELIANLSSSYDAKNAGEMMSILVLENKGFNVFQSSASLICLSLGALMQNAFEIVVECNKFESKLRKDWHQFSTDAFESVESVGGSKYELDTLKSIMFMKFASAVDNHKKFVRDRERLIKDMEKFNDDYDSLIGQISMIGNSPNPTTH